jgi:hypothetical protein
MFSPHRPLVGTFVGHHWGLSHRHGRVGPAPRPLGGVRLFSSLGPAGEPPLVRAHVERMVRDSLVLERVLKASVLLLLARSA